MKTKKVRDEVYRNAILSFLHKNGERSSVLISIIDKKAYDKNYEFIDHEKYILKVHTRIQNIISCIEEMLQIELFLRRFANKEFFSKYGFNETHYLEYHLKNAITKAVSFRDLLLHLTNDLLELRVEIFEVTKISRNSKMRKELSSFDQSGKLLELFNDYDRQLKALRKHRNYFSHEGIFYDDALDEIDTSLFMMDQSKRFNMEIETWMTIRYHNAQWKLKKRKKEIVEMTQHLRDGMELSLVNITKMMKGQFFIKVREKLKQDEKRIE